MTSFARAVMNPSSLNGKTVCLTGALASMTRAAAFKALTKLGATPTGNLSRSGTHLLIVGDKPGSKLDTARRYGIPTMNEEEFCRIIDLAQDASVGYEAAPAKKERVIPDHYGDF